MHAGISVFAAPNARFAVATVDPDIAYPMIASRLAAYAAEKMVAGEQSSELLELAELRNGKWTQYTAEVIYQLAKLQARSAAYEQTGLRSVFIRILGGEGRRSRWNATQFPPGRGAEHGRDAVRLFQEVFSG